ncbi:MAG: HDIG domain-containing metalloprotein [Eubacteriales bacterium]
MRDRTQIYLEIDSALMNDPAPSDTLNRLSRTQDLSQSPFDMLTALKDIKQSPKHHPEGSVWNHTMLVADEAAQVKGRSKSPNIFMWAALLHDIGKARTTRLRGGRITSYDHDKTGEEMAREFLSHFAHDEDFIASVSSLVRWHMHILYVTASLPYGDKADMLRSADIEEVALLGLCDRLGRLGADREEEEGTIRTFLSKCGQGSPYIRRASL